jgi:hypothetical protein
VLRKHLVVTAREAYDGNIYDYLAGRRDAYAQVRDLVESVYRQRLLTRHLMRRRGLGRLRRSEPALTATHWVVHHANFTDQRLPNPDFGDDIIAEAVILEGPVIAEAGSAVLREVPLRVELPDAPCMLPVPSTRVALEAALVAWALDPAPFPNFADTLRPFNIAAGL